MKLSKVEIFNYRSFDHLSISIGDRLTLFLGENGAGKTNVLDGIAVGLGAIATMLPEVAGISFKKTDLRQVHNKKAPFTRVILASDEGVVWGRTEKRDNLPNTLKEIPKTIGLTSLKKYINNTLDKIDADGWEEELPLFVYYGVSRALIDPPLRRRGFPKTYSRFHALTGALEATSRFRSAFKWFYAKEQEELRLQRDRRDFNVKLPEMQAVREAIETIFPGIKNPRIETNPLRLVVDQNEEKLNITQLSDGYKTMLALVIDLTTRMALANPHLKNPLQAEAIVMIDEVDLHLHPEWQRRVLADLLRVFPQAQFIVTTHSPYIVESINNYLQLHRSKAYDNKPPQFNDLIPLDPNRTKAYLVDNGNAASMMDEELGLLDNSLLETFNTLSSEFVEMQETEGHGAD